MGFAQHQSFHIRDGWLRKGLIEAQNNPFIFTDPDAYLKFGLGKNMVEALRFWMVATGLTIEENTPSRKRHQILTQFGNLVIETDPYLEDDGTLWLIHYHLLKNKNAATAWYWFFNHFGRLIFDRDLFVKELSIWNALQETKEIATSSIEKDFDCLVRTYLPRERNTSPEDILECPLVHLKLLSVENENGRRRYNINRPEPTTIPPLVLLYVIKRWQEESQERAIQVSLRDMLAGVNSPGRTFLLGMRLNEAIRRAVDLTNLGFTITRTAGLDTLSIPNISSEEMLLTYYHNFATI